MSFFKTASLNIKLASIGALVGVLVALIMGMMMYFIMVAPVEGEVRQKLINDYTIHINAAINLKNQSGILGATAMTLQQNVKEALYVEDRDQVLDVFETMQQDFAAKSDFKNINTILLTADARMLVRSWDIESYGQDTSNSPLIQRGMKEKRAFAALGVGARGVGVVSISPIMDGDEFLGMISLLQGLRSVVTDFKTNLNADWMLIADKRYLDQKYSNLGVLDENKSFHENYILANNNWFDETVISQAERHFIEFAADASEVYLAGGKAIISLPAYDEENLAFGRHLILIDEDQYLSAINAAQNSTWFALTGVLLGIFLLTFILVWSTGRMVVRPLQAMQRISSQIIQTGDFATRMSVNSQDEVGQTSQAINQLLEQVGGSLKQANETVGALAKGNLSQRMDGNFVGDLAELKDGINTSADSIEQVIQQFGKAMQALRNGEFHLDIECQAEGSYLEMMNNAQDAMNDMDSIVSEINSVMTQMMHGDFSSRVNQEARGAMLEMKEHINDSMDQLDKAIKDITRIVVAQSEGDLTQTITNSYEGDLLELKNAINASLIKLSGIVNQALNASQIVRTASQEVSQGSLDLSQRIQEQAAALEETSASMEQMTATVDNTSDNAQRAAQVAGNVQRDARHGENIMQQTITAMNAIQESSHKISEIVNLIDGIAFQTNLLALNAAVEAARAGDHGRGFAVVAGEVRALAQRSADAARDITNLIEESVTRIDDGTKLAQESGDSLLGILHSIEEVTGMINEIAQASGEQAQGVNQVHQAVSDIDSATQQSAALVEETSAAAESMSDQAQELTNSMSFFKTGNTRALTFKK